VDRREKIPLEGRSIPQGLDKTDTPQQPKSLRTESAAGRERLGDACFFKKFLYFCSFSWAVPMSVIDGTFVFTLRDHFFPGSHNIPPHSPPPTLAERQRVICKHHTLTLKRPGWILLCGTKTQCRRKTHHTLGGRRRSLYWQKSRAYLDERCATQSGPTFPLSLLQDSLGQDLSNETLRFNWRNDSKHGHTKVETR
jgi:hypothetical protein